MKKYLPLGLIVLLFLVTRIYKISQIPASVYWDEASIGYNAYAISTDLKDEWGEYLPLHFRAFGEFKLPVYIYNVAILTKIFGSNELTLRLPAVIYSLGTVIVLYLLVKEIAKKEIVALFSVFIFAVSPWMFIFSRTGFEATAGLFFFLLFIYLLILYQKKKVFVFLAVISAILSIYSYNSFRILVPITIIAWAITQKHRSIKLELISLFIFLLSLIPIVRLYLLDSGAVRLATVGAGGIFAIVKNYFSHFDPQFLFTAGDVIKRHIVPSWGELYLIDLPLLIFGIWKIVKEKKKEILVFLFLLLIAPIPAAVTRESPHALRAILMAPMLATISAIGLSSFKKYYLYTGVLVYLLFFGFYLKDFYTKYNMETASDWQYEYKQSLQGLQPCKENLDGCGKVVISDRYGQPYIFALYYQKYSPEEFRSTVKYNPVDRWGFSTVSSFGEFEFR